MNQLYARWFRLRLFGPMLLLLLTSVVGQAQTLYWITYFGGDGSSDRLGSSNLDGTNQVILHQGNTIFRNPTTLWVEPATNSIYVGDGAAPGVANGGITRFNMTTGAFIATIVPGAVDANGFNATSMKCIQVAGSKIYWVQRGIDPFNRVCSANLDGTGQTVLVQGTGGAPFEFPSSFWVDAPSNTIYVGDEPNGTGISRYNMTTGAALGTIINSPSTNYTGLQVVGSKIYWVQTNASNAAEDRLCSANLDGTGVTVLASGTGAFVGPQCLWVDVPTNTIYVGDNSETGNTGITRYNLTTGARIGGSVVAGGSLVYSGVRVGRPATATTVTSINRASTSPTNVGSVNFTVTFAQAVTGLTASNFSLTTTGSLSGASVTSVTGSGTTYTVAVNTGSGSGTLRLDMNNATGLVPGVSNLPFTGGQVYDVDRSAPAVNSVSVPANGTYKIGDQLDFVVNFNEAVTVNAGVPSIALTIGSTVVPASYIAGSGTSALAFRHVVGSGQLDVDGIGVGALTANGATLRDAVGNNAVLTLNGVPSTANVRVDGVAPTVVLTSTAPATTSTSPIPVAATFSESVTGFLATDVTVTNGSITAGSFSGSGTSYTFTVTPAAAGTVTVNVPANVAQDMAGNGNLAATALSRTYTAPTTVTSINRASANPTNAASVSYTVTFAQNVTGLLTTNFEVTVTGGNVTGASVTSLAVVSGNTYTVNVNTGSGSGTIRLDMLNSTSTVPGVSNLPFTGGQEYTIDRIAPAAPFIVAPINGSTITTTTPTYSGVVEAGSTVTVFVNGVAVGTTPTGSAWSLLQPTPLTSGSYSVVARATDAAGNNSLNSNTVTFTVDGPARYDGSTASQASTAPLLPGSANQAILQVAVTVSGGTSPALSASNLTFSTNGSTTPADIAAARVYYTGTSSAFAATTAFGAAVAAPNGAFSVAGSQNLSLGVNYFWLVYDVADAATGGNVLDANLTSLRIGGTDYAPTVSDPAGNRRIVRTSRVAGQALRFAGGSSSGYVEFSAASSGRVLGGQYTQEVWIKPAISSSSTFFAVLGNGTGNSAAPYIGITGNGRIEAGFGTGSALRRVDTNPNTLTANAWNHVVATYNGTTLTIYLDGESVASANVAGPVANTPVNYIGARATTGTNFFPGDIEEVSQWSRALSATEIRQLRHLVRTGVETDLVSYLQFNDSAPFADINGAVGTLTGGARVSSTAPVGFGASSLQTVASNATFNFAGTGTSIAFSGVSGTSSVVVTRLEGRPLGAQPTGLANTYAPAYWIINKYGTGNFSTANVTYTLSSVDISAADAATPSQLKLLKRPSNSDAAFEAPISATAASATAGTVTFPVTSFSQTVIGTLGSSPLPVELVSFTAERTGSAALLRWTTAQELNNAYFAIESSPDGRRFAELGRVAGRGTTTQPGTYVFTDPNLPRYGSRLVYYRLRQVDLDGAASLSEVRVVATTGSAKFAIEAYPNPHQGAATPTVRVRLRHPEAAPVSLTVTDAVGRVVLTRTVRLQEGQTTIALTEAAQWPQGVYLLRMQQNGQLQSLKLLRE